MKRKILIAVAALFLGSTLAAAGPIYFGIGGGKSSMEEKTEGQKFSDDDTGSKLYAGFGMFKFFRIEGTYDKFGSFSDESGGITSKADISSYGAYVLGVLPMGKHVEVFVKAGAHYWSVDSKLSGAVTDSSSDAGTSSTYGVGAAFLLFKHLAIRLEHEQFNTGQTDTLKLNSLGAEFRF
jgi:OOP family OmpA-OmpF porin